MLEKIGLPAKPSMRGGNWVVDATHCQGCSSQFTFINRKHHCRRCGGLFCNSCTLQRMILRGQGDSPVRICDPCKKLEDATRFELRYGHKSRAAKGNPKQVEKHEEDILGQILGTDSKQQLLSGEESHLAASDLLRTGSGASSSNLKEAFASPIRDGDTALTDIGSTSPQELRQQAVEEKKRYRILKGEGKSEEALQAFKRGRELERQAGALEIASRKNRRMASKASNMSSVAGNQKIDESEESGSREIFPSRRGKKEKDDLAAELRELGWSDADLHDSDKKPVKLSLEGELSNLLGEIPQKSSVGRKTGGGIDKSQVVALKKKALLLKREGKLAEAKEELKKAKILEKQLEEQELLGEAEDSDDELSALINSMDDGEQDELLLDQAPGTAMSFDDFTGVSDDPNFDGNLEVTADDMNDPDLAAALRSFGWTEEVDEHSSNDVLHSVPVDREALQSEVLTLKREALSQKHAGNVAEAMALLKKAKLLERDLETMQSNAQNIAPEVVQNSSSQISGENVTGMKSLDKKVPPKSKIVIQKELLALKKKALALRREGRLEEADEELKKGKVLEEQLEDMENAAKRPAPKVAKKSSESIHIDESLTGTLLPGDDGVDAEVTEQDMQDPALLSVLKNLGWNDDDVESVRMTDNLPKVRGDLSGHGNVPTVVPQRVKRSKAEIQRELLGLKRKALALRRQGKADEAEEELERAKDLEKQITEMEASNSNDCIEVASHGFGPSIPQVKPDTQKTDGNLSSLITRRIPKDEEVQTLHVSDSASTKIYNTAKPPPTSSVSVPEVLMFDSPSIGRASLSEEGPGRSVSSLLHSGPSVNVGTDYSSGGDGKILLSSTEEPAKRENSYVNSFFEPGFRIHPKENTSSESEILSSGASSMQMIHKQEMAVTTAGNKNQTHESDPAHGINAYKDEILARKRNAVSLKREGKLAEAREELRQAKLLEKSLEGRQQADVGAKGAPASTSESTAEVIQGSRMNQLQKPLSGRDRFKLQQESLAHKRNALKLRREGKIDESEAEFELAKALENQLDDAGTQGSSSHASTSKKEAMDDAVVEDLFDPQLMSALKAIGWEDSDLVTQPSKKPESNKPNVEQGGNPRAEKAHLDEQIKAEKLRALNLKRAGKQPEALEALRNSKRLEKKLNSLT